MEGRENIIYLKGLISKFNSCLNKKGTAQRQRFPLVYINPNFSRFRSNIFKRQHSQKLGRNSAAIGSGCSPTAFVPVRPTLCGKSNNISSVPFSIAAGSCHCQIKRKITKIGNCGSAGRNKRHVRPIDCSYAIGKRTGYFERHGIN